MSTTCTNELFVEQMRIESEGVMSLVLRDPHFSELPEWTPGAHIDVEVGHGLIRQYSLCSDPNDRHHYRIGVLREPNGRGGSDRIHGNVRPGHTLMCSEPLNNFELDLTDERPLTLIAGGIGITPILAMAREAKKRGHPFRLYYGGKTLETMAFRAELDEIAEDVHMYCDDVDGPLPLDEILSDAPEKSGKVYVCGPAGLLDAVSDRAQDWPPGTLRLERFSPVAVAAPEGGERAFTVICAQSQESVEVPADCSILQSLEEAGIDVPNSCREGMCGTCETPVLSGTPDHRDSLLSAEEQEANDTMMLCVSRSKTDELEIDI